MANRQAKSDLLRGCKCIWFSYNTAHDWEKERLGRSYLPVSQISSYESLLVKLFLNLNAIIMDRGDLQQTIESMGDKLARGSAGGVQLHLNLLQAASQPLYRCPYGKCDQEQPSLLHYLVRIAAEHSSLSAKLQTLISIYMENARWEVGDFLENFNNMMQVDFFTSTYNFKYLKQLLAQQAQLCSNLLFLWYSERADFRQHIDEHLRELGIDGKAGVCKSVDAVVFTGTVDAGATAVTGTTIVTGTTGVTSTAATQEYAAHGVDQHTAVCCAASTSTAQGNYTASGEVSSQGCSTTPTQGQVDFSSSSHQHHSIQDASEQGVLGTAATYTVDDSQVNEIHSASAVDSARTGLQSVSTSSTSRNMHAANFNHAVHGTHASSTSTIGTTATTLNTVATASTARTATTTRTSSGYSFAGGEVRMEVTTEFLYEMCNLFQHLNQELICNWKFYRVAQGLAPNYLSDISNVRHLWSVRAQGYLTSYVLLRLYSLETNPHLRDNEELVIAHLHNLIESLGKLRSVCDVVQEVSHELRLNLSKLGREAYAELERCAQAQLLLQGSDELSQAELALHQVQVSQELARHAPPQWQVLHSKNPQIQNLLYRVFVAVYNAHTNRSERKFKDRNRKLSERIYLSKPIKQRVQDCLDIVADLVREIRPR